MFGVLLVIDILVIVTVGFNAILRDVETSYGGPFWSPVMENTIGITSVFMLIPLAFGLVFSLIINEG